MLTNAIIRPCLSQGAVLPDRTVVRIATGSCCPYCNAKVRNDPEETAHGWRQLCPNGHDFIVVEYPPADVVDRVEP